jgi:TatD DNase family protein
VEPAAGISYFDSHCHLQDERLLPDISGVLGRARNAGVRGMMCCGSCQRDWQMVHDIAVVNPQVVPSFGLHPWYLSERTPTWHEELAARLAENPAACVGEIGLDHALDKATFADQETALVRQLDIASRLARPVSIHCRRAFGRVIELLRQAGGVLQGGIVHSYSGPPELVKTFEDLGLSISFSGSVSFPKSKRARASIAAVSLERLCIETDSPDIVPFGCGASVNEPANIVKVAMAAAEIRGVPVGEIAELTYKNASRVFGRKS